MSRNRNVTTIDIGIGSSLALLAIGSLLWIAARLDRAVAHHAVIATVVVGAACFALGIYWKTREP